MSFRCRLNKHDWRPDRGRFVATNRCSRCSRPESRARAKILEEERRLFAELGDNEQSYWYILDAITQYLIPVIEQERRGGNVPADLPFRNEHYA